MAVNPSVIEKLVLCDKAEGVVVEWERAFAGEAGVSVVAKDILRCGCDAVLSPANGFGDMGGGLDKHLDDYTKGVAQHVVRERIRRQYFGELPVGSAFVVSLGLRRLKHLVVAPTMRIPGNVAGSLNAYLASRAALVACARHNAQADDPIRSLAAAGLCTGVGRMAPEESARQMHAAYRSIVGGEWQQAVHPALAPFADRG